MKVLIVIGIVVQLLFKTDAFRWHLEETIPTGKFFTFSERFMFASGNGPIMLEQGSSYINVDVVLTILADTNNSMKAGFAVYAVDESKRHENLANLCGQSSNVAKSNLWAKTVESEEVLSFYEGTVNIYDPISARNVTWFKRSAQVMHKYSVRNELWHNVVFLLCSPDSTKVTATAAISGEVTFRNPYGFIPAELYGILPFEGARMVAYVLFSCYFLYHYIHNKESILPLHNAFLIVFLFALAEATMWYATYQSLNLSGQPYCCPFPPTVVGSLVLQIFRQTFSRTLLLVVCLGYGIVRPKLMAAEWLAIAVVSLLYFVTATIAQVSDIILVQDGAGDPGGSDSGLMYKVPELFMDVIFLTWIYLAIGSTVRILTEFRQTVKLKMYQQLVTIIGIFAALFTIATVVFVLDDAEIISWPWQWSWVQQVLWESLNFAVLAAVCFICKPSENSRLLSYASQLPTEDPDEDEDDDLEGGVGLVPIHKKQQNQQSQQGSRWSEHNTGRNVSHAADADKNDEHESETEDRQWMSIGAKSSVGYSSTTSEKSFKGSRDTEQIDSSQFDALPAADGEDDEDYGLND